MAEEQRLRIKALKERLRAKRRAKEAELEKRGAGERERCDQDAGMTCLEELETEVHTKGACRTCVETYIGLGPGDTHAPLVFRLLER